MASTPTILFESVPPSSLPPSPLRNGLNVAQKLSDIPCERPNESPLTLNNSQLVIYGKPVNSSTYASILESCKCPKLGKQVQAHVTKTGFQRHEFVETKVLQMYARCGVLEYADLLFDKMHIRNLYSYMAILTLYLDKGIFEEALLLFQELLFEDFGLEFFVFPAALNMCSSLGSLELGRQLHGMIIKYQFFSNIYVGNALIDMYGKCGSLYKAKKVLAGMPHTDSVSWNSVITACAANGMVYEALDFLEKMKNSGTLRPNLISWSAVIGGFAQNGYDYEAIELLCRMKGEGNEPNARTLASILPACARLQKLSLGKILHGYIMRHGFVSSPYVVNGLVDVYRRCGNMDNAFKIFSKYSQKNGVSFNTMIVGYCENGYVYKAKELFENMELAGVNRDLISWNSLISGYVDNFLYDEALNMFKDLLEVKGVQLDSFTLGSVLTVCADMTYLRLGRQIHSHAIVQGLQSNSFVGGALVEMYSRCQNLDAAQMAFDEVNERDTATWNVLIASYARYNQIERLENILQMMKEDGFMPNTYTWNGILAAYVDNEHLDIAMQLFCELLTSNTRPDIYTIGIILDACSKLATLERGKQVHAHSIRCCHESDTYIGVALVDMYAKCGSIRYAELVYNRIPNHNLVSHNAMLTAYAMHGHGEEGIALFRRMLAAGFRPDHVTFLSVLSSCVHVGSVETGYEFFNLMGVYGIKPELKHFTAMVDLLSRSGQLRRAYELIKKMPMEPDSVVWGALLGGCVIHGNVEVGEIAAEKLIELEPNNTGNYVLLGNLYAYRKRWYDVARIRQMVKDRGLQKSPGCSWIEDKEEIHSFVACDKSHKTTQEIYNTLNNLTFHLKKTTVPL